MLWKINRMGVWGADTKGLLDALWRIEDLLWLGLHCYCAGSGAIRCSSLSPSAEFEPA